MVTPPKFSHTRLSTLDDCPRKYRYRYVDKLEESFQGIEAFRGQAVHAALEWLYVEREAGRTHDADALVERFRQAWSDLWTPRVKVIADSRPPDSYRADAEEWLRRHHATTFRDDRRETIAMEERIEINLGSHAYYGFMDRLARDRSDGRLHVVDYKTSKSAPASAEEAGLQVRSYGVAVLERHLDAEVVLEYDYLRLGRRLVETLTREQVPAIAGELSRKIDSTLKAEGAGHFPARPSALCRWCGFREICDESGFGPASPRAQANTRPARGDGQSACPQCGSPVRVRRGSRGAFVGCTGYPRCRWTRDAGEEELS